MPNTSVGINGQNAGLFSDAAYTTIGEPVPKDKLPAGWSELTNWSTASTYSANNIDTFRMFVNTDTQQIVIAFKGTDTPTQGYNDLANAGAADYKSIEPLAQAALLKIQDTSSVYAGYQIFTDGHSLGGGMAQSFALENGLSGFGQNSLPVAPGTISNTDFFSSPSAFNTALQNYQAGLTQDSSGNTAHFTEFNVSGDPATAAYSWGTYLDKTPTTIPSPYATAELLGMAVSGYAIVAWLAYQAHSIATLNSLMNANGDQTTTTNPSGAVTTQYGDGSASTKITNPADGSTTVSTAFLNGNTSVINRDAQGNVISVDVRTANSDGSYNTATSNANGTISNSVYDANNQLVSSTIKDTTTNSGTTQTYTNGVLTSKIDFGASSATTTDYNPNGTVSGVTTINSDNTASSERYNSNGATIYKAVTDSTGAVTTSYTNNDGSISTRYPDGAVTTQSNSGNNYTLSTLYPDNSTEVIGYASGVVSYDAISYANGGDSNTNYQNGIVTSATLTHPDGSGSITHYNLDGSGDTYSYQADKSSSAVSFNKDGSLNRTENISATGTQDITIYGANNVITSTAKSFDDGSGLVKTYYADGTLKQQWFTQKDGSGSVVNNSADGKSGTTVVHNADGSGSTSGFNADGTSYARVNNADKSFNETTYFADGKLASLKITLADGSGSYKTYTNSGVLTSQLMRNADGSYSSDNYTFYANGTLASETHAKSDGSSNSKSYFQGDHLMEAANDTCWRIAA